MTPEAQRIAIAEACGWSREPAFDYYTASGKVEIFRRDTRLRSTETLPDYLNDLNAMAEAEKVLTEDKGDIHGKDERCRFITHLGEVVGCWNQTHNSLFQLTHATAAQRSEAFLKTLGRWVG